MVNSTVLQRGGTPCILADGGAFHLAEFARTLCPPFVGSAVHGGIHILQIQSSKLALRMLVFPALKSTFKVRNDWKYYISATDCGINGLIDCLIESLNV